MGNWIQFLIGALVGGVLNWVANGCEFSWRGLGYFGAGAAIGAGTVALGGWVAGATQCAGVITGAAVGAGVGAATGAVSSVVLNGLNNVIGGQNFWNNWQGSLISGASSGAIGGVIGGGIKGYHLAKDGGRNMWWGGKIKPGRTQWSFFNSEKPQIFKSPVHNNYGTQNGECALRCLEKISESYGLTQNDYEYWYSQNGSKLGVDPLEFENMVNSSGVLSAKSISGINSISEAFSNDQRVVMGLSYNGEGHAVMVNKVKMWSDGTYRIFFKETSPSWIVPRSTNNVFNIKGFRFWSVYK